MTRPAHPEVLADYGAAVSDVLKGLYCALTKSKPLVLREQTR
jgi:hypothetical protein